MPLFSVMITLSLQFYLPGILTNGDIPSLTVRDEPDRTFRAIYQDFSGCRILNTETVRVCSMEMPFLIEMLLMNMAD